MADWYPYLETLFPSQAGSRGKIEELLKHRTTLFQSRVQAEDRAREVAWFDDVPVAQQLFALPNIAGLLSDRSDRVRSRVIQLFDDLLAHTHRSVLADLEQVCDRPTVDSIQKARRSLTAMIRGTRMPRELPFSAVPALRLPIFAMCALAAVEQIRRRDFVDSRELSGASFVSSPDGIELVETLDRWLRNAPFFVRYVVLHWIDSTNLDTWKKGHVDQLLLAVHRRDLDGMVAAAALQIWARSERRRNDITGTVEMLEEEYAHPRLVRQWQAPSTVRHAAFELAGATLRALAGLAVSRPDAPEPRDALRRIITARPSSRLNLFLDTDERRIIDMFRTALLIRGTAIRVMVRIDATNPKKGNAGFKQPLRIVDPEEKIVPDERNYWVTPTTSETTDPARWIFRVRDVAPRADEGAADLLSVISPSLAYERVDVERARICGGDPMATRPPERIKNSSPRDEKNRWPLRDAIDEELDGRGGVILEALRVVGDLLEAPGGVDSSEEWMIDWLSNVAPVIAVATAGDHVRNAARNKMRHLLLTVMSASRFFDRLFPSRSIDDVGQLEASLLASATEGVPDALPGDESQFWIRENRNLLLAVAQQRGRYDERTRARIALALLNSRLADESPWREALAELRFDESLARMFPPVVAFFNDDTIDKMLASASATEPAVTRDWAMEFGLHSQRLARTLGGVWPYAAAVEHDTAMCMHAVLLIGSEPRVSKAGKQRLPNDVIFHEWNRQRNHLRIILRRVTTALANQQEELSPELRQLRDGLVRLPDGAELRAYVAIRSRHAASYDSDWTRILVRLLSRLFAARARTRQTTVHRILQELATPGTVLSELVKQAEAGGRDFLRQVLFRRDRASAPPSSSHASLVQGEILLEDETSTTASLALLQNGTPVRVPAGMVVPAFLHRATRSHRLRCIASIPHIPEHAVDLHSMHVPQRDKLRLLQEGASRPAGIIVVGRVVNATAGVIDIGIDDLRPTMRDRDLIWGAAIAVRVRLKDALTATTPQRLPIRRGTEATNLPRASMLEELTFERVAQGDYADEIVNGTLTSSRDPHGRRTWTAHVHGRDIPIYRRELTSDLYTLFELDAAGDDDPIFERLATEPLGMAVRGISNRLIRPSVVDVPPLYDIADVVLAAAAGELNRLVFSHEEDDAYVFEFIGTNRATSTLPVFGAFASIRPEELLDEKWRPLPATRLRPGATVYVDVLYRSYERGGWKISKERDLGSVPLLGVIRTDRQNIAVRELFGHDKVVSVHVHNGQGELLAPPQQIPCPTVRLLGDGWPEGDAQAIVRQWYPADLSIEVEQLKTVKLANRSAKEWIGMRPPMPSQGVASWISRSEPRIRVDGLLVVPDWTFRWLPPEVPTREELALTAQQPVLITRIEYGRTTPLREVSAKELPWMNDGEQIQGIVVSQPEGTPPQVRYGVLWNHSTGEQSWQYVAGPADRMANGDLFEGRRSGDMVRINHTVRRFYGTTIFRAEPSAATEEAGSVAATLIALPEEPRVEATLDIESWDEVLDLGRRERDSWLFVVAPAKLVEIPRERLRGSELLENTHPLAHVTLRKLIGYDWVVEHVGPGAFDEAMTAPWKLQLYGSRWPMKADLSSTHEHGLSRGEIRYDVRPENLPIRVDRSANGARRLNGTAVDCTLTYYELYVTTVEDGFFIEPSLYLGAADTESLGLPSLELCLARHKRLDDVDGHTQAGTDGLVVQITNYACNERLPLPLAEQTWLPLSRQVAQANYDYRLTVIPDKSGAPLVSLRRQPPLPLVDWLDKHGLPAHGTVRRTLYYFGEISDNELAECGCSRGDFGGGRLLLLERAPGDTVIVPLRNARFLGLPFDTDLLAGGDAVTMFRIIATDEDVLLDIREVVHDILQEVTDYDRRQGLFYAQFRRDAYDVHGLFGDRLINIEQGWQVQIEGLEAGHTFADGTFVYVKFNGADKVNRILRFKLIDVKTAFTRGNLVYVQANAQPIRTGGSLKLLVSPLAGSSGNYFIPDTLYSRRRWRLRQTASERSMFLAKVYDDEGRLSLIHVPLRSVETLLAEREPQVVVTHVNHMARTMEVELREGVNVRVPFERFADQRDLAGIDEGDILMLERTFDANRLIVADCIRSHRAYIEIKSRPTMLVELWSDLRYREQHRDREGRLSCNIVGLAQLNGRSRISEQNFGSTDLLPHVVTGIADHGTIALDDQLGGEVQVGQIEVSRQPHLSLRSRRRIPLAWRQITYQRGCAEDLQKRLATWNWRDTVDRPASVNTCTAIAPKISDDAVDFTAAASRPLPPDHIVEQFGDRPEPGDRKRFVAASAERERIVLEIAPGRYAALHTRMIAPLFRQPCIAPRAWEKLGPGDVVTLEIAESSESQPHPFLPSFRVSHLSTSQGRELERGAVVPLFYRNGHVVAGPPDRGIHVDDCEHLLVDKVLDLRQEKHDAAVELLRATFRKYGSRVVLKGTVKNWTETERGRRLYVEAGVRSLDGGDKYRDPSVVVPSDGAPDAGTAVRVRVLDLTVERRSITKLACDIRVDASPVRFARFGTEGAIIVASATRGDIVAVYMADDGSARVSGYEHLSVTWSANQRDNVEALLGEAERADFLHAVLGACGRILWATLEGIGQETIVISRRRQIERLLGAQDITVLGTVLGPAGENHVIVDLHGVPSVIGAPEFVRGLSEGCRGIATALAERHAEIEVLVRTDGRLSAVDVYENPPEEFEATVECCLPTGVVCGYEGTRLFVPLHALAWCELTEAAMRAIFEPIIARRDMIPLRRLNDAATQFSHKRIVEFSREARRMNELHELSRPVMGTPAREPEQIFITPKYVDAENKRAVVASHEGLLMELQGDATGSSAYVVEIDLRRRKIVVATSPAATGRWMLPRYPTRQLYSWSEESFREAAADIAAAARHGVARLAEWLTATRLTPTFRNIRVVLKSLHSNGIVPSDLAPAPDSVPPPLLASILSIVAPLNEKFGPTVAFARGYWDILKSRMAEALPNIRAAAASLPGHVSLDVQLTLARVLFALDDRYGGSDVVRSVCHRLFAGAHLTLPLVLIRPAAAEAFVDEWTAALRGGNLESLRVLLQRGTGSAFSVESLAARLWIAAVEHRSGEPTFERDVVLFLEALHDEEDLYERVDARFYALAAHLCFAAGDTARGWRYLDRIGNDAPTELGTYVAWQRWLRFNRCDRGDDLLEALNELFIQTSWRRVLHTDAFNKVWEKFHSSPHEWQLPPQTTRIVPAAPDEPDRLDQWGEANDVRAAVLYLRDVVVNEGRPASTRIEATMPRQAFPLRRIGVPKNSPKARTL